MVAIHTHSPQIPEENDELISPDAEGLHINPLENVAALLNTWLAL